MASWTAGRTYVAGETMTASILNEQLRDRPDYVKEVIDGTAKQDVTIAAAQALKHGTQAVMRASGTTKQHVEMIDVSVYCAIGATNDVTGTWSKAFSSAPKAVACKTVYNSGGCDAYVISTSTTGCTVRCSVGSVAGTVTATVVALGPD